MTIDLTGGVDPSSDHFLAARPDDPQFRESASAWISDDAGLIGLPRIGIEAVAESWDKRDLQVNLGFPDGRTVVVRESGEGRSPVDADGVCRTFAAGGLEFRHVEPFKTLTVTYDGTALDTTAHALARGDLDGPRIRLRVDVELTIAAPPWVPGTMNDAAAEVFHEGFAGAFISPRYEQLCTSRGTVRAGDDEWSFTGTGLRIHRQGVRDVGGFWGHCWPSALFPSGRGFGGLAFPERPDGQPTYNEALRVRRRAHDPGDAGRRAVAAAPPAVRRGRRRSPCAPPTATSASRARPSCRRAWPVARTMSSRPRSSRPASATGGTAKRRTG